MPQLSKILVITGILLVIAGLLIWLAGDRLNWIGRLPGDIRIERENMRFYFPITTMILVSLIVSFILWVGKKMF